MTVIVGALGNECAVIGADTELSFFNGMGMPIAKDVGSKLQIFTPGAAIFAHTGASGERQRMGVVLEKLASHFTLQPSIHSDILDRVTEEWPGIFSSYVSGMVKALGKSVGAEVAQAQAASILHSAISACGGGLFTLPSLTGPVVVHFDGNGCSLLVEDRPAAAMGSGGEVALPFLGFVRRVLWKGALPEPDLAAAGVLWTVRHAIRHAGQGVGGCAEIAMLKKVRGEWTASLLDSTEIGRLDDKIDEIEKRVGTVEQ